MSEELKPCPWCGSNECKVKPDEFGDFYISCGSSGGCRIFISADTEQEAIEAWNTRVEK